MDNIGLRRVCKKQGENMEPTRKKILIVDDATFMQKVTSSILSQKYDTICVSSGQEAIELYEREKPDMILTDLIMPHMTGLEMQRILLERYNEHIPIMFMTADESEESEDLSLAGGAMDYIRKPFKAELLLRRVDNIMRHVDRIQSLRQVAEVDPMTGLLNKAHAQRVLGELCRKATGTLMMVDLDSFKLVNDLYGHGMGDRILIRFSDIIRSVIRSSDVAGRMGGDEFIVFCQDIRDEAIIAEKAHTINKEILASAKEFMGEDMNIPLGASIGAVSVPDEGRVFTDLYAKADKALYRVKQNGKHGYAIFRGESAPEEKDETVPANSLDSMRMILGERSRPKGAFELGSEAFQAVYRFLMRSAEIYHRAAVLAMLSLRSAADAAPAGEEETERFGALLAASLRRSDVICRSGKGQYLVLLPETDVENGKAILARVLESWQAEEGNGKLTISCEDAQIQ